MRGSARHRQRHGYCSRLAHALQRTDEGDGRAVATPCYADTDGRIILPDGIIVIAARPHQRQTADNDEVRHQVSQSFHCLFLSFCLFVHKNTKLFSIMAL